MKRVVFAMLAALLVLAGCGQAKTVEVIKEVEKIVIQEPITLQWATEDAMCPKGVNFVGTACAQWYARQYEADHPGVKINATVVSPVDGTTAQLDAYILAGLNPNVMTGYAGRLGKYRDYAVGLPYDPAKWQHPAIDGWVQDGKLAIYPMYAWAVTMQVNYTYAHELGVDGLLPDLNGERTWTIDQFKKLADALKAKNVKTDLLFCQPGNGSGDYSTDLWALGFGGKLYEGGDFTKLAVNSPEWASAWKFLKGMVDGGYFVKDPWALTDDDFNNAMATREVLIIAQERAAVNSKGDELRLVSFPSPDGKFVPFATAPTGILVFDNAKRMRAIGSSAAEIEKAEKAQAAAVEFAVWLNEGPFAAKQVEFRGWTWRTDIQSSAPVTSDKDSDRLKQMLKEDFDWMVKSVAKYGLSDCGTGSVYYSDLRLLKVQSLADVMQGKATAEEALAGLVEKFGKLVK